MLGIGTEAQHGLRRGICATMICAGLMLPGVATAQQIIVLVNGEPITALDIEQRSKLDQLSTHKVPPRQEVLDELISDILKVKEAKKWGMEYSDPEIDSAYANMASRMRLTPDALTQLLAKSGVKAETLKRRIRADMLWPALVRGRFQASLQIGEKDLLTVPDAKADEAAGYDYVLRPILLIIPSGSGEGAIAARRRDAESLRGRFDSCDEGLSFARALKDVAVREQMIRSSADLPPVLRKVLDDTEQGKLTPPETTKLGIEMFAVCSKKPSTADNTPGKRKARETIAAERYEQRSKLYLEEVRRGAYCEPASVCQRPVVQAIAR